MTADGAPGKVVTFYSYKGGTGRSMALANVAWVLASNGRRVLVIDWDLEAPGLHRYFYPFLIDRDLTSSEGVIDFVINFEREAMTPLGEGETLPPDWYKPHADIVRYAVSLDWEFPGDGTLDFIPAGRQGDSYSSRVTSFNWQNFYDRLRGGTFLEAAKERMREEYDYILIDSRTGVSDTSGICTVQMPDALVVCFTLNHQSIEGAAAVATSVYEQRRGAESGVQIFPVPMRVDNNEKEKLELRREYAKEHFERFPVHIPHERRGDYWGEVEVIYVPYYAYEEIISPFGDKRGATVSLLAAAERLTAYLTQGDPRGQVTRLDTLPEAKRQRVLASYARKPFDAARDEEQQLELADEARVSTAEDAFAALAPDGHAVARRVLTRLVRISPPGEVGPDTRLRLKKSELGVDAEPVLDELVYRQLVLLGQDEATREATVELAHDALVHKWDRMRGWLAEDRDFLLWRQGLQLGVAKWERVGRDEAALLHGAFLSEAEQYEAARADDLGDTERVFIRESARAEAARLEAGEQLIRKEELARLEAVEVRKEKKRLGLKFAALTVALLLAAAGAYQLYFYRERTLVFLGLVPERYTRTWEDDFNLTTDRRPDGSLWIYPSQGQWAIEPWEDVPGPNGALLVKGDQMGVLNIKPPVLTDFKADFKVRIVRGAEAAWVFRAQPGQQRGYVFVLTRDLLNRSLTLNGYVYHGNGHYEPLDADEKDSDEKEGHKVPFRDCCLPGDAFRIRAEVKGNEFKFWVTVDDIKVTEKDGKPESVRANLPKESKSEYSDTGVEFFIEPFRDDRAVFPYGNVGLFERDGKSEMKVDYMYIWPSVGKKVETAHTSSADNK